MGKTNCGASSGRTVVNKPQRVARPRTKDMIEEIAWRARGSLGLSPFDRVPVAALLEFAMPRLMPDFEIRVANRGTLGAAEAITDVAKPIITFDERVYDGLCRNKARPRMTAMHELGHLLMHTGQTGLAYMNHPDPNVDLERQADIFAAAFMMPECAFKQVTSISDAMRRFGVSRDAASYRARSLKMFRLLRGKPIPRSEKKKGHDRNRTP